MLHIQLDPMETEEKLGLELIVVVTRNHQNTLWADSISHPDFSPFIFPLSASLGFEYPACFLFCRCHRWLALCLTENLFLASCLTFNRKLSVPPTMVLGKTQFLLSSFAWPEVAHQINLVSINTQRDKEPGTVIPAGWWCQCCECSSPADWNVVLEPKQSSLLLCQSNAEVHYF